MLNKTDHYFLTIVREGNLNRAAEALYVSQPSLTKYIQRLERQLGTELFDRTVTPMRLNDAGRLYYRYLMTSTAREKELMAQLDELNHMERGTLRLGIPSYCGQCYLPWVLDRFVRRYPAVELELFEERGETIERAVAEQHVDLGILHLPISDSSLYCRELFAEQILLAAPRGPSEPVPGDGPEIREGRLADFAHLPFILPHPEQKLGRQVAQLFSSMEPKPRILMRVQNVPTKLSLTATGMGACFVPAGGLSALPRSILDRVVFYRLRELDSNSWKLVALTRPGSQLPPYAEHFIQLLADHGSQSNCLG